MISPAHNGIAVVGVRLRWSRFLCHASVLASLLLSACDGASTEAGNDNSTTSGQTQGVLSRLWTELQPSEAIALRPIGFPEDLSPHPEATSESFELQAILMRADGAVLSVQAQLDRVALGIGAMASSDWGFSDIMRSSVVTGMPDQPLLVTRETIERRALGLADSDESKIHVIDTELKLQVQSGDPAGLLRAGECGVRYHFSTLLSSAQIEPDDTLSMDIAMPQCPEALSLHGLNRWQASALTATATQGRTGSIAAAAVETPWQGHVWLSQTWGNVPLAGGAVLMDQVSLRLMATTGASPQLLSASRSKRRSGRGPQTVQGTISTLADHKLVDDKRSLPLQWVDEGKQTSLMTGIVYPQRFRLRSEDESIDLQLTPLVTLPEIRDSLGIRWNGAVKVSGTHEGTGFLIFQPVSSAGPKSTSEP